MQADRRIGIELPLWILIWQGSDRVILGYRESRRPQGILARRAISRASARLREQLARP